MAASLDGIVDGSEAIFEALRMAVLSSLAAAIGFEIAIPMDPLYLTVLESAEKKFWRCVQSGEARI
jgi:hypothetical protein